MSDSDAPGATGTAMPAAAALVRDFVNTVEWQVDDDSWRTPEDLASWWIERTALAAGQLTVTQLTVDDLALSRRVREGLRSVLLINAGHDPLARSIEDLNEALGPVPLRMRFDVAGSIGLTAAGDSGIASPLAVIVDAIEALRSTGSWARLKACSRDSCRWAYWDGSRNLSGRWCSMAGCGNYIKMRRRNSPDLTSADAIAKATGGTRAPTLLDVAGRAGVSIKTVSNVVTGASVVAEPTRSRVQAAIDALGYRPDLAARALRARRNPR